MRELRCVNCGALIARFDSALASLPPSESRCVGCSFPAWRPPPRDLFPGSAPGSGRRERRPRPRPKARGALGARPASEKE